ncbi:hypothetical protein FRX57_06345 [Streptococcus cuniculipharyngis]|uniref:Type I restriction modification DNA specificity domain-containing protein n=1 Tax=Streptococcus cuniculipharyngis TaxID=1562651 RepID=A0A5C5SBJ7_9STRE|nr:restriction endonuclease subunit S [Streptococcus cuniculipharyngis]TWS96892.1 hypothetical protein FRX57_06345 [Streptococcus cuniculipharyngis]
MGSHSTTPTKGGRCCKKAINPALQKLDDDFIKAGGEWKKIAIETLFEKIPTKKLPYKARDLKNKHDEVYCLPALTAGVENQGLAYYVPVENATILKNCISVSANGANTGVMYYQSKEFTVLQDAYAIRFKEKELSELAYLYFVGVLQKAIRYRYNWSNKAGWERIKSVEITVPYVKNELAFSYMETYIKTLEAERIETLEAYLTVTGLKDYHLTEKDEKILDKFVKLSDTKSRVEYLGTYAFKSIFNIYTGQDVIIGRTEKGNIPLVSHQHQNNGISVYIKQLSNRQLFGYKETLALADRGVFLATTQANDFYIGTRVKALQFKDGDQTSEVRLFVTTAINKLQILFTEYSVNATNKLPDLQFQLPVKNGEIDYTFMFDFIRVIEKLVIKDLVEWTDKKIEATKEVVASH